MASPPQPAMDVLTLSEKNLKQTGLPGKWSCSSARSQHFVFVILRWAEEKSMVSKEGVNYHPQQCRHCLWGVLSHPSAPRNYKPMVPAGGMRCALWQENTWQPLFYKKQEGCISRVTRKYKLHNTAGLQIVKRYKMRNVSTTIQHVLRTKYI